MFAARAALQDVVDRKEAALVSVDANLRSRLMRLGEMQRDLIATRADAAKASTVATRQLGADRLGRALDQWMKARQRACWNHWRVVAHVMRERDVASRGREAALAAQRRAADDDRSRTCALLLDEYKTSKDATVLAIQRVERRRIGELELMAAVRTAAERCLCGPAYARALARRRTRRPTSRVRSRQQLCIRRSAARR